MCENPIIFLKNDIKSSKWNELIDFNVSIYTCDSGLRNNR